jgi:hypothetical protein
MSRARASPTPRSGIAIRGLTWVGCSINPEGQVLGGVRQHAGNIDAACKLCQWWAHKPPRVGDTSDGVASSAAIVHERYTPRCAPQNSAHCPRKVPGRSAERYNTAVSAGTAALHDRMQRERARSKRCPSATA